MLGHPARGQRGFFFFLSCHATHVFCYCLISFFFSTHGKIPQKRGAYFLSNSSRLLDLENTPFLRRAPRARGQREQARSSLSSLLAPQPRMSQLSPGKTHTLLRLKEARCCFVAGRAAGSGQSCWFKAAADKALAPQACECR